MLKTSSLAALAIALLSIPFASPQPPKADRSWPMFGGTPSRNMVNLNERGLPAKWSFKDFTNIKWMARLDDRQFGSPIVARGKVFVATHNRSGKIPNVAKDKAVMLAFRESDGVPLWHNAHDYDEDGRLNGEAPSTPAVDGDALYYVTPSSEVIRADADTGKIRWRFDMTRELKVCSRARAACVTPPHASPLVVDNLVFVTTNHGVDDESNKFDPEPPSFVAFDKNTGKVVWKSNLPSKNGIEEGQWSSPAYANAGGVRQVIFAGGDSVVYSFVPETGELIWKCDCLPIRNSADKTGRKTSFAATPVVVGDRLFVGLGRMLFEGQGNCFTCLDITKKGDVSFKSYDAKADENRGSALVWALGGPMPESKNGRQSQFYGTRGAAAVHDGLVYVTETMGYVNCLDAATGRRLWSYDCDESVFGSPYLVDGRVIVSARSRLLVFAHGRERKLLAAIEPREREVTSTAVAAKGVLYVIADDMLYAIANP